MRRRAYLRTVVAGVAGVAMGTTPVQAAQTEVVTEWSQEAELLASDGAERENFGSAVAVDGDTALVGTPDDSDPNGPRAGSAYAFERVDDGWAQRTKIAADDGQRDDQFGVAVAVDGDTALVGAPEAETANGSSNGAAYVFERSGGTWSQATKIASDKEEATAFGNAVALDGDTALVGARTDNNENGTSAGAAYAFDRSDGWSREAKLIADDGNEFDELGVTVGLDGDRAVLGTGNVALSAYVFERSGGGWSQAAKLVPDDADEVDNRFGIDVAVAGETTLVGALGSAYAFDQSDGWSQETKLTNEERDGGGRFGYHLSLDGGRALIGAHRENNDNGRDAGAAYIFDRADGTWNRQARVVAADGARRDRFGEAVALDDDTALVGAPRDDTADGENAGSAYVFVGTEPAGIVRYADDDGVIRTDGLRSAIDDWRSGDIDTAMLRDVIEAWRSGEPVVVPA